MRHLLLGFALLLTLNVQSQSVLFYNVENLFDTIHDNGRADHEFLPHSAKEYGSIRYRLALRQTARALRLALYHAKDPVEVIALCEVETRGVLQDLAGHKALRQLGNWRVVHYDSPDFRGIDCGALVNTDLVSLQATDRIRYANDTMKTRDALVLSYRNTDSTLQHLAVVHFSSKRGGAAATAPKRAYQLNRVIGPLDTAKSPVLICGDFNDGPSAKAYRAALQRGWMEPERRTVPGLQPSSGSYKYKGRWQHIDLGISKNKRVTTSVLSMDLLLEEDRKWGGFKPKKRWQGTFFVNGYSDHLPVYFSGDAH